MTLLSFAVNQILIGSNHSVNALRLLYNSALKKPVDEVDQYGTKMYNRKGVNILASG